MLRWQSHAALPSTGIAPASHLSITPSYRHGLLHASLTHFCHRILFKGVPESRSYPNGGTVDKTGIAAGVSSRLRQG
jgi:hypothetical protein